MNLFESLMNENHKISKSKKKVKEDFDLSTPAQDFNPDQVKVLDELSYLLSTEYEAIEWYDEAIPEIQASGLDPKIIEDLIQGIRDIRKDESDHVAHIERLIKAVKGKEV